MKNFVNLPIGKIRFRGFGYCKLLWGCFYVGVHWMVYKWSCCVCSMVHNAFAREWWNSCIKVVRNFSKMIEKDTNLKFSASVRYYQAITVCGVVSGHFSVMISHMTTIQSEGIWSSNATCVIFFLHVLILLGGKWIIYKWNKDLLMTITTVLVVLVANELVEYKAQMNSTKNNWGELQVKAKGSGLALQKDFRRSRLVVA